MTPDNTVRSAVGKLGEKAAAKYLKRRKYKIIASNVHAGRSEIDLVAANGDTLVFVEVKTRTYSGDETVISRPADAVNKSKMTYLIRGADRFCAENGTKYSAFYKRFDIIEVYLESSGGKYRVKDIRHFEGAFGRNR